jgi:hypothetical protein
MLTPMALDLAHAVIRDRLQQAARDRLADRLRHSPSAGATSRPGLVVAGAVAPRHWLASGLRSVAARLDPSASVADASLVVLKAR